MRPTFDPTASPAEFTAPSAVDREVPTLGEIFSRHLGFVWRMARALGLSPDDADDVAQEVFLVVQRRLHTFQPGRSLCGWLFGITRNVAMHHRRARSRREQHLSAVPSPPPAREPDASLELQQAAALMQRFLAQLDDDKRIVLLLADVEGLTAPEIAEALAIPLGTVFSRLRAARLKLEQFSQHLRTPRSPHER